MTLFSSASAKLAGPAVMPMRYAMAVLIVSFCTASATVYLRVTSRSDVNLIGADEKSRYRTSIDQLQPFFSEALGVHPSGVGTIAPHLDERAEYDAISAIVFSNPERFAPTALKPDGTSHLRVPCLLDDRDSAFLLVLAFVNIDDQDFAHVLMRGGSGLVLRSKLPSLGFHTAVNIALQPPGIRVEVGTGALRIDRAQHSFGLVNPDKEVETTFRLDNIGTSAVIVGRPSVACSCVRVVGCDNPVTIGPGDTFKMRVVVSPGRREGLLQGFTVPFYQKGTGDVQEVAFMVSAVQRKTMVVHTRRVDFGTAEAHAGALKRVIRLSEVATDRFAIVKTESAGLPLNTSVATERRADGLRDYILTVTIDPMDVSSDGLCKSVLRIHTDSAFVSVIEIPVQIELQNTVIDVRPTLLSFGTPRVGAVSGQQIHISDRAQGPITVTVSAPPSGCQCTVEMKGTQAIVTVWAAFMKEGMFRESLTLTASTPSHKRTVQIPLTALVLPK